MIKDSSKERKSKIPLRELRKETPIKKATTSDQIVVQHGDISLAMQEKESSESEESSKNEERYGNEESSE